MELFRVQYCEVGDCNESGEKAHLITRATLPKKLWDMPCFFVYLCRRHHSEQHSLGIESFCSKYDLEDKLSVAKELIGYRNN